MAKKWDKMNIIAGRLAYNRRYPVHGRYLVGIVVVAAEGCGVSVDGGIDEDSRGSGIGLMFGSRSASKSSFVERLSMKGYEVR